VALLAFARRTPLLQQSVDISCLPGPQQQTCSSAFAAACPLPCALYIVSQKTRHQTLSHNFTNYYPIFKFFSPADSVVNLQQTHV